jgi:hypothetical protein
MALIESPSVVAMSLFELYWACRVAGAIRTGNLTIWAPDGETAIKTVRDNPSMFGLTEHAIVGHATTLRLGGSLGTRVIR